MGVSKNSGTPKPPNGRENPIRIDDLGVPLFLETPIYGMVFQSSYMTCVLVSFLCEVQSDLLNGHSGTTCMNANREETSSVVIQAIACAFMVLPRLLGILVDTVCMAWIYPPPSNSGK